MNSFFETSIGSPLPFGATSRSDGVNFSIYAKTDRPIKLLLWDPSNLQKIGAFELLQTGSVYHVFINNVKPGILYSYEIDSRDQLLDPYAKSVHSPKTWNDRTTQYQPLGIITPQTTYDWENDVHPHIPKEKLIIYEMHVRGFTQDTSSKTQHRGAYLGIVDKIQHLKELGINAIELLPLFEFNETEYKKLNPITNAPLCNYWGYSTVNFFSPMNRYAHDGNPNSARHELKDLIKELHRNEIEVILDVVYNHTGEGNELGPVFSFKGLANSSYYLLDENGLYLNFSGCGNTLNCNDPIVQELIINSLRYWVIEFHVDGFRFDLASILTRGTDGAPLPRPPLIEAITKDPILSKTKLFAEAWDAAGLYQIGHFHPHGNRWSEWNGLYRDTIRRFIKGINGIKGEFATRICGSKDLYHAQSPAASVNYITCHDGFTLADLVSYNQKHNRENGEDNRDGTGCNDSWNCGIEGPTEDPQVLTLRRRQMRNFHVVLMTSQGIPLLNMGDEYAHTKRGNNNTWCQDNELNWFLWNQLEAEQDFFNFYKFMINIRRSQPHFHYTDFITDQNIQWHGTQPHKPNWGTQNNLLAFTLHHPDSDLYIAFNAGDKEETFELPPPKEDSRWEFLVNTGNTPPNDIFIEPKPVGDRFLTLVSYSSIILKS